MSNNAESTVVMKLPMSDVDKDIYRMENEELTTKRTLEGDSFLKIIGDTLIGIGMFAVDVITGENQVMIPSEVQARQLQQRSDFIAKSLGIENFDLRDLIVFAKGKPCVSTEGRIIDMIRNLISRFLDWVKGIWDWFRNLFKSDKIRATATRTMSSQNVASAERLVEEKRKDKPEEYNRPVVLQIPMRAAIVFHNNRQLPKEGFTYELSHLQVSSEQIEKQLGEYRTMITDELTKMKASLSEIIRYAGSDKPIPFSVIRQIRDVNHYRQMLGTRSHVIGMELFIKDLTSNDVRNNAPFITTLNGNNPFEGNGVVNLKTRISDIPALTKEIDTIINRNIVNSEQFETTAQNLAKGLTETVATAIKDLQRRLEKLEATLGEDQGSVTHTLVSNGIKVLTDVQALISSDVVLLAKFSALNNHYRTILVGIGSGTLVEVRK